jgi:hypothetical protein
VISSHRRRRRRRRRRRHDIVVSVTNIHQNKTHSQNKGNVNKQITNMTEFSELKAIITTYALIIIIGAFRILD